MKQVAIILCLLFALATAISNAGNLHLGVPSVFGNRNDFRHILEPSVSGIIPEGWRHINKRPSPKELLTLTFALKQRNLDKLEEKFWAVSDPQNKDYGNFLTKEELTELVAPLDEDIKFVQDYIVEDWNVPISEQTLTLSKDFIIFKASVSVVEKNLKIRMRLFEHNESGARLIRTLHKYSLPAIVAVKLDFIGGLVRFPEIRKLRTLPAPQSPLAGVTPASIKSWYNIPSTATGKSSSNTQSVSQFLQQYYRQADLSKFLQQNNLPAATPTVIGPNGDKAGTEATLDIEFIMGVATGVKTYFIYTEGLHDNQEPFLTWITNLNNMQNAPITNSISYGDTESTLSADYINRVNTEFQKFGSTGHSILFASGDSGVGCVKCQKFAPAFPASSPYVTAVGGTTLRDQQEIGVGFSGGGFSNAFTQPSYQKTAVANYLQNTANLPSSNFYNAGGRAYPDISAFSVNFNIVVDGFNTFVDGTSCAAPTASAIVSLLNDLRLQQNKQPLGFLNPMLYQNMNSNGFNDIVKGQNTHLCCTGFPASKGWDPVTGIGSLNYEELAKLV